MGSLPAALANAHAFAQELVNQLRNPQRQQIFERGGLMPDEPSERAKLIDVSDLPDGIASDPNWAKVREVALRLGCRPTGRLLAAKPPPLHHHKQHGGGSRNRFPVLVGVGVAPRARKPAVEAIASGAPSGSRCP